MHKGNNNELDRIVRSKLNQIRPDFKPGSWDQLAARLAETESSEAFDQEIGDRLHGMQVPYRKSSWAVLAARLELERKRIQAVLHYKLMEVSLLLLLFITAWQHLPVTTPLPVLPAGIPIAAEDRSSFDNATSLSEAEVAILNATNTIEAGLGEMGEEQQEGLMANTIASSRSQANSTNERKGTKVNSLKLLAQRKDMDEAQVLPSGPTSTVAYANDAQEQLKAFMAQKTNRLSSPSDAFRKEGALAGLAGNKTPLLDYGDPDELLAFIRPVERKTFLRIGFVGSPDYNRVITPTQEVDDGSVVSYDRYSLGYAGGITIGVEHGRWEIETGALYAARRYQAIPTVYVSGNLREGYSSIGLTDFELNTVTIPLDFRYNFLVHNKWRMYAQAGASLNLVLDANYYLGDQAEFAGIERNPVGSGNGTSALEKPEPLLNKSLTAGWLEGGSFWDNATLYGDIGIGLERYMTPNWSMFVQPTYRHALPIFNDGLGPYKDKIHKFGIGMGLKVRL